MIVQTLLTLAPILILLIFAALIGVLHIMKRGSSTLWITAVIGALFAWLFIFLNYRNLQIGIQILPWSLINQNDFSPAIQFTSYSWPYALAVGTILLSSLLVSIIKYEGGKWIILTMSLLLGALGVLSVLAHNPVTLVLAWAAMDICIFLIVIAVTPDGQSRERTVVGFSVNIMAVMLLSWLSLTDYQVYSEGLLGNQGMYVGILVLAVIGMRVGGITILSPVISETNFPKSLSSLLYLVPTAAAFALFNTIQILSFPEGVGQWLVVIISIIVFINALLWVWKADLRRYQTNWIIILTGFVTVSVIRGDLEASLAWGVALVLSGGILFLVSVNHRLLIILAGIALINISMLPYTPTWVGTQLFAPPFYWGLIILLISHIIILLGFFKIAQKIENDNERTDRFTWALYFWGLFLLPIVNILIGFLMRDSAPLGLSRWLGLLSCASAVSIFLVHHYHPKLRIWSFHGNRLMPMLQKSFTFRWLWKIIWSLYRGSGRGVYLLTQVMEGDGGILWTLLLLVLFITLIRQFS